MTLKGGVELQLTNSHAWPCDGHI